MKSLRLFKVHDFTRRKEMKTRIDYAQRRIASSFEAQRACLGRKFAMLFSAVLALTLTAGAQSDVLRAIYERSATIPTNVEGIFAYPVPPEGFDPLTASDEELAAYGIPFRPDKAEDPAYYRQWTRLAKLMANPHARWYGELKPRKAHGSLARVTPAAASFGGTAFGATSLNGPNWSGVVNTVPGTKWSSKTSFSFVVGEFNVPWPQQAFSPSGGNICDGDTDQASFWVGLDGMSVTGLNLGNQSDIAQTGVDILASCSAQAAVAWVEWYPANSVTLFQVYPGDDISVMVQDINATSATFQVWDHTIQQSASYKISAPSGFQLAGNEAEYIVERPLGDSNTPTGYYPLANYVWSFWDFSRSKTFGGTYYYPGSTNTGTFDISMTNDSGTQVISVPNIDKGLQNLFVSDENCAYLGGCAP